MATTPRSTLVTQAQALMKEQGLSYADAAKQARANITPTPPTTPPAVTPTTPPVQNELTKQDVLQSTKGMTLEDRRNVMQNSSAANVIDQTPPPVTTTPAPPAPPVTPEKPVTPVVTETPKVEPIKPVTPTTTVKPEVDRTTQINQNLTEGFNNNPSLFANYDTYKKAYGYDTKPQEERDQLDAFFQSKIPQDTNTMYQSLKVGGTIPEQAKNSKAYIQAKEKYNVFSKFNSMTPDQLYSSMVSNDIGTELSNELAQNPNYVQAKAKYDAYMKTKTNNDAALGAINAVNGVKNTVTNPLDKLNETITKFKDENTLKSYRDYLASEDPELVTDVEKLNEKTQLLQELIDERDDMTRTIIKDTPGISKGAAYALAARRNESLNDQIRTMTYEQNALSADVKYRQGILDKSYEFDQKSYQDSLDFAQQSALAQYQTDLSLVADQAKFEQTLAQQAKLAKDPVTGVQQILKTYADMGILPTRSQQEIITDIENQVAQGIPVETALTNLNKAFQSKPEYQQYMAYQKAKMTPETKTVTPEWKQDASGNWYNANASTSPAQQIGTGAKPSGTTGSATVNGKTIQLDSIASQSLNNVSSLLGSGVILGEGMRTRERQAQLYEAYKNGTGGLAAPPGQSKHETGMAIDIYSGKDKNGKLLPLTPEQVKVMNDNGWVQNAGADDMGHFEYVGTKTGGNGQISPLAESWANNILNGKAKLSDLTGKENIGLKNQVVQVINAKSGGSAGAIENNVNEGIDLIDSLIKHPNRSAATGFTGNFPTILPGSVDFEAEVKRLEGLNFLNAIPQMKGLGALTENEGAALKASVSKLSNLNIGEQAYLDELNRLKKSLERIRGNLSTNELQTTQNTNTPVTTGAGTTGNDSLGIR